MPRITRKLAAVAVSAAAITAAMTSVATAAPESQDSPQAFHLDSRAPLSIPSPHSLRDDRYYVVTVSGVVSFYSQAIWTKPKAGRVICGTPARITFPTADEGRGVGGADAETLFAGTAQHACGTPKPPFAWSNFEMSVNGWDYADPTPMGGTPSKPSLLHTYNYAVVGEGRPIRFTFDDVQYSDNNGSLLIVIRRANALDCKFNGWKNFSRFANEHDCTTTI
jgi:hypothetical protein